MYSGFIGIRLPGEERDAVIEYSTRAKQTITQTVRQAIREYLVSPEVPEQPQQPEQESK